MTTTTPTSGAADLPEALRRATAADGKTELFNIPGHPLMVRAVDFNRLYALAAGQATAAQQGVVEALSGVQELTAAPAIWDELRDTLVAVSAAIAERDDRTAQKMIREILAASPTPPAEQQAIAPETEFPVSEHGVAITTESGAVYAELPQPDSWFHFTPQYWGNKLRDFADATHALRASHGQAPVGATLDVDIDAIALARYKVVPSHESMFHRFAVVAGDGEQQLYLGRETECQNMARKFVGAFLDGAFYQSQAKVPTPSPQAEDTQQAPAKAAPAAVAGPREAVKFTDQSTADPVEKARRYLTAMGSNHLHSSYFFDDGYPKQESATDALATLAVLEQLAAAPTTQPTPKHQARPVTPYTCPKCSALWLHWPAEQSGFGRDTLNCRSTTHCDYCEKGGVEQLQRLERVPAVLAAPQQEVQEYVEIPAKCPYFGPSPHRDVWLEGWYAACATKPAPQQEASPTTGMNIAQRILHVGGRNNAAGYVEFGSIQAVEALVRQVLRDLPSAPQPSPAAQGDALDAERWRMAALVGNEVMVHPDKRNHAAAVAAYMQAVSSGLDLTAAIDAARAAQGGK